MEIFFLFQWQANQRFIYFDPMSPNRSNVAKPMSKLLDSIESRGIERDSIERRKIERRSTKINTFKMSKNFNLTLVVFLLSK